MLTTRTKRTAAVVALSCSLFAGAAITPAAATSGQEGVYLAALKQEWPKQAATSQQTTCSGYKTNATAVITLSVNQIWKNAASRQALSKPAWKRVITKYLAWACSGPGTTPR
jgi:hypothetical protein